MEAKDELNKMNENEMPNAVVLACVNTTATRLGKLMADVCKHVELWWWYAGVRGGDSAVARVKVHAPGVECWV